MSEVVFYKNGSFLNYTDPITGQLTTIPNGRIFTNGDYFELENLSTRQLTQIGRYFTNVSATPTGTPSNAVTYQGSPITYQGANVTYGSAAGDLLALIQSDSTVSMTVLTNRGI